MSRFRRMGERTRFALLAIASLGLLTPALARAEAPDPFTYVAEWSIARDQWSGYSEWTMKHHKPILERLAADGTLVGWGFYETYIHTATGPTHGVWWTSLDFAGIEKARVELLKAPFHPAAAAGAHRDLLLRASFKGSRSGAVTGGFLYVNTQVMRPGKGGDWSKLWEQNAKPVLDELVAQGALAGYSVQNEDVHTAPMTARMVVTVSTSAAAEDQIEAAFAAAAAKRSPEEREALAAQMRELTDTEAHRDYMARVLAAWFK